MKRLSAAVLTAALFVPSLQAWNYRGHMLTACVAYQRLSPGPKARIDDTLRRHPDYPKWMQNAPAGVDRGLEAFMQAAVWPDVIKGDDRFWEPDSSSRGTPTPMLPGFPDMQQHRDWHYRDMPISAPGAPAPMPPEPNLVTVAREFLRELDEPYKLAWWLHLAGDAHQPLHSVSRFVSPGDKGDAGGNKVALDHPAKNLHAFWDRAAGTGTEREELIAECGKLEADARAVSRTDLESWMAEGGELARSLVYTVDAPKVTPDYERRATEATRKALGLAGARIAAVLNDRLQ